MLLFSNNATRDVPVGARLKLFAEVLINLAGCDVALLALVSAGGHTLESVRIGVADSEERAAPRADDLHLLMRQAPGEANRFTSLPACHPVVARLLGEPPVGRVHSIIGRATWRDDCDLILVAGWRATCMDPLEESLLSRGVNACGRALEAAGGAADVASDGFDLIHAIVPPVVRVDERLNIISVNEAAERELVHGGALLERHGRLASAACHAMEDLRAAVRRSVRDAATEGRRSSIIPLNSDAGLPRFAIVAPYPVLGSDPTAMVVLPEVDGEEGARRLASLYSLTRAEEGVVRLILIGAAPVSIAADLGLTEATVRTYIKRIMLKLGINRRSEFFLLYILTMSPFRYPCGPLQCKSA